MPTQSLRPKQAQPNARRQLKVQQLLISEIEQLQQPQLQAQQPLTINKPIKQIPKQTHKKMELTDWKLRIQNLIQLNLVSLRQLNLKSRSRKCWTG
ncbi:hypothetical protein PMIT1327_02400 [Prochlorococcus marinus str. MIT 1327]|nr:hypothetical protein PMIT1312_01197 [Prochlorococcus marinus str. MIT 1312]KZR79193.1 hypothetical protein PMIT1327_02400 [Prochlorococcus marinus str. MIT 1327]